MRGRWRLVPLVAAMALLLVSATSAFAKPVTFTFHEKQATESFPTEPEDEECFGSSGTITITYNAVFHVTAAEADFGDPSDPEDDVFTPPFHVTFTQAGRFVIELESGVTYTGHFSIWGGFNVNDPDETHGAGTFTFHATGKGSDGSQVRLKGVDHFNMTPTGLEHAFERFRCDVR